MVGDLGLGKALDVSSRLTMIAGTPSYVAPEQAQGEHLDARADQYSLAALAYLLLAGRPPYAHSTLSAAADPAPPAPMSTPERSFPPAVEDAVRRGLAADREERWPDVPAFVAALRTGLGESDIGELPARWLPVDPELTQPGNRPSLVPSADELPEPVPPPRSRRRWPAAVLAVVLLAAGAAGGFALWRGSHTDVTHTDDSGFLSVTVPRSWDHDVSPAGWNPPDTTFSEAALSVGDRPDWATSGQGVFVGLMPEEKLPTQLPRHRCDSTGKPVRSKSGDPSLTVTSTGCSGAVIIERAVQVTGTRLMWVQVRSDDLTTARHVLASVHTHLLG
jgi:serine/threonine protein kinase